MIFLPRIVRLAKFETNFSKSAFLSGYANGTIIISVITCFFPLLKNIFAQTSMPKITVLISNDDIREIILKILGRLEI